MGFLDLFCLLKFGELGKTGRDQEDHLVEHQLEKKLYGFRKKETMLRIAKVYPFENLRKFALTLLQNDRTLNFIESIDEINLYTNETIITLKLL